MVLCMACVCTLVAWGLYVVWFWERKCKSGSTTSFVTSSFRLFSTLVMSPLVIAVIVISLLL